MPTNKTLPAAIRAITDKIVREYKPEKIILFGSYAWGTPHEDSDVDLLIVKNSRKRRIDRERELRTKLYGNKFPAMDVLVYTSQELNEKIRLDRNLFLEDIVNNGIILYGANKVHKTMAGSR